MRMIFRRSAGFLIPTLVLLTAACTGLPADKAESAVDEAAGFDGAARAPLPAPALALAPEVETQVQTDPMLIRTGDARIEVDTLEPAVSTLRQIAADAGGMVSGSSITTGDRRYREATLTLRVPAARFDAVVGGLRPLGRVESVNVQTVDAGEEMVDLSARLESARQLEQRLLEILRTRTGDLEDVLAVERELARVRTEIERYEGRMRYLRGRIEMSHLTVTLHEPVPLVAGTPGENVIARAARQAWRNFVGTLSAIIAALGFLIPAGVVAGGAAWVALRLRRRHAMA